MPSIAEIVRRIVLTDPAAIKCLSQGFVNYSKLAKLLVPAASRIYGAKVSEEAVKSALLRLAKEIREAEEPLRLSVLEVLSKSFVELRTGVAILIVKPQRFFEALNVLAEVAKKSRTFAAMLSVSGATILVDDVYADEVLNSIPRDSLTMVQRDLAAIIVVSPPEIMFVPGVVAYITAVMSHNNINILHIESSYTDTVIVISKEDALRAFSVISEHIELAKSIRAK